MKSVFRSRFFAPFVALVLIATGILFAQNTSNYSEQGGESWKVGGTLTILSGGNLTAASGSTTNIAGTFQVGGAAVTATAAEINETILNLDIADGSADATYYVVAPHAGTISKIYTVTDGVVGTADIVVTGNIGATPITNGAVTIATAASAAGDIDIATPTAANVVTAGQAINFAVTGGGSGGSPRVHVAIVLTR